MYQSTSLGIVYGLVQVGYVQNLRLLALKMADHKASKVYVVSHTNKTANFGAILEIPYFQPEPPQKPKYSIC